MYDLQRASSFKRFSAFLFDFIILTILAVGCAFLISGIVGYDSHLAEYRGHLERYEIEYGIELDMTGEEFSALTEEERARYDAAEEAFSKDEAVIRSMDMLFNLTLVMITLGLLVPFLILELLIPLLLKNGQTLGKKIFGVGVMFNNGVKLTSLGLFARGVLGKYTVETMIPVLIVVMIIFFGAGILGIAALILVLFLEVALFFATKNRTLVHDIISGTVTVDMMSQMIFDTYDEMVAYKKRVHAELAEKSEY